MKFGEAGVCMYTWLSNSAGRFADLGFLSTYFSSEGVMAFYCGSAVVPNGSGEDTLATDSM